MRSFSHSLKPPSTFPHQWHLQRLVLLIMWALIQALLIWKNGIVSNQEAEKYIFQAQHFLSTGSLTSGNYWLYSTQIFLIAAAIKLRLGYISIVVVQLTLNLLATFMFLKLATFVLKGPLTALVATLIFIVNIPYQAYNSFLFTESIFYSLTIIYSSYLLRIQKLSIACVLRVFLLLALLSVTRPTGILFLGATGIYLIFRFGGNLTTWRKMLIIFGGVVAFLAVLNILLQSGGSLDFMLPFKKENIICGVNTVENAPVETSEKGNSLPGLLYYMLNNGHQFLRLAKLKTISFFGLTRDYYSGGHNLYLRLFFYPFYLLAIAGARKMFIRKEHSVLYFSTIVVLYWTTTLLTCDDWHNRFILTIFPFIFLIGLAAFAKRDRSDS